MAGTGRLLSQPAHSVWRIGVGRPRVLIMGGVHGNERTGVEVVKSLVDALAKPGGGDTVQQGELTLAIGNPEAVEQNVRFVEQDLNRCFGLQEGPSSLERRRAIELEPYLTDIDVLVDLHATNKPSYPFVRLPGPLSRSLFRNCRERFLKALPPSCETVLWDPSFLIGHGHMSDEFALSQASTQDQGTFICYEAGLASDISAVPATGRAVEHLLSSVGLRPDSDVVVDGDRRWQHLAIVETVNLDERGFEWMNGFGSENFQTVPAGVEFGRRLQDGVTLSYPQDSCIVFPKIEALWGIGKPLGWLATHLPELPE